MDLETEIASKAVAPRVTPADVQAEIVSEHYFTAADGAAGSCSGAPPQELFLLTFCVLVLRNGFTVTGESACASPENYDPKIGCKVARQKAEEKIWPLLGFRLRDELSRRKELLDAMVVKEPSQRGHVSDPYARFRTYVGTSTPSP